jgi:hypothetical protein
MTDQLYWFRFNAQTYLSGDISYCSLEAQGLFIHACALYWKQGCSLTIAKLQRRQSFAIEVLDELLEAEVLVAEDGVILIPFLDAEFSACSDLKAKRKAAGKKGGLAKASKAKAKPKQGSTIEEYSIEEKRREEYDAPEHLLDDVGSDTDVGSSRSDLSNIVDNAILSHSKPDECDDTPQDVKVAQEPPKREQSSSVMPSQDYMTASMQAWFREIGSIVGPKIGKGTWQQWERLVIEHGVDQVLAAARLVPADVRWPDKVEVKLTDGVTNFNNDKKEGQL